MNAHEAAALAGAQVVRDGGELLTNVADAAGGGSGALTFDEKLKSEPGPSAAIIVTSGQADKVPAAIGTVIEAKSPRLAFALIAQAMFASRFERPADGDDEAAEVHDTADVHPSATISPGARIGANAIISPAAVIGHGVEIGADCLVGSGASITHATLGEGCRISSGARIGESGFGYTPAPKGPVLIPQLGAVRIGHHVDIGANSAVDRGMLADTVIGDLCKIDNLCQIGHNCRLGVGVIAASLTGISGSCVIGDGVMMGGQVGMADHLNIGDGAILAARSGIMKDVEPGAKIGGFPAKPLRQWMKEQAQLSRMLSKNK